MPGLHQPLPSDPRTCACCIRNISSSRRPLHPRSSPTSPPARPQPPSPARRAPRLSCRPGLTSCPSHHLHRLRHQARCRLARCGHPTRATSCGPLSPCHPASLPCHPPCPAPITPRCPARPRARAPSPSWCHRPPCRTSTRTRRRPRCHRSSRSTTSTRPGTRTPASRPPIWAASPAAPVAAAALSPQALAAAAVVVAPAHTFATCRPTRCPRRPPSGGAPRSGSSTMMSTGTGSTATGAVNVTAPWTGASVDAAPSAADPTAAATGPPTMSAAGAPRGTGAMSGAESENERDTGTGMAEDHLPWKGPTIKSLRNLEGVTVCQGLQSLLDAHQTYLGRFTKMLILGPQPLRL